MISTEGELGAYFSDNPIFIIRNIFKKNNYQLILIAGISGLVSLFVYLNRKKYYMIKFYSEYDPLTHTLNRRAGYDKIANLIYKDEGKKALFSLCFIDVNGLKQVNDHLGHEYGDGLLTIVCDTVKTVIREYDFIIRQGGDEFIIVFDKMDKDQAEKVWDRIVSKFDAINKDTSRPYIVSVSHGVVEYNNTVESGIDELIQRADEKMYEEKKIIKASLNVLR